ncbi:MAG: polyprenyl synthetase family protein [Proteobacteria bacterium]|nr:polyprenyl synthetase family protein [Pseudomonadota bacterium]MBU1595977.1 polyprenyl synthetase family protein [Pseudomonadota bacterium]
MSAAPDLAKGGGLDVKAALALRAAEVEACLAGCLRGRDIPERLLASMEYSLHAGGKRLRPALLLSFARLSAGTGTGLGRRILPFAAALELIHTYSLIHDDLPAMDDDDLRRGKPSNHRQFDEATAILAGDGLLTEAFTLMLSCVEEGHVPAERVVRAAQAVAVAAGAGGMVGGQALDMEYTARAGVGFEELRGMHAMKTGALITVACVAGAVLAGAQLPEVHRAREYGRAVGQAFQIADDILDVTGDTKTLGKPAGSDERQGKTTYPSLLGLPESRRLAGERADAAVRSLEPFAGPEADFLRALARYIVERVS